MENDKNKYFPTFQRGAKKFAQWFFCKPAFPRTGKALRSKRFWKWTGLVAAALFVLGWWNLVREKPLEISPETTIITRPRTADGRYVDYCESIRLDRPREMKTDENGARILVRELRPDMEHTTKPDWPAEAYWNARKIKAAVYRELGLDPTVSETTRFTEMYSEFDKKIREKYPKLESGEDSPEYKELSDRFRNIKDDIERCRVDEEFTRDYLARNNEALDIVVAASKAKVFKYPFSVSSDEEWPEGIMILLPCIQEARGYARALAFRAGWRLTNGEIDGALDDIVACRNLGNKLGENADFLVDALVGNTMIGIAANLPLGANAEVEPSAEQWRRFYDHLAATPSRLDMVSIIDRSERYCGPDIIAHLAATPRWERANYIENLIGGVLYEDMTEWFVKLFFSCGFNWNTAAREYNRLFDRAMNDLDAFRSEIERGQLLDYCFDSFDGSIVSGLAGVAVWLWRGSALERRSVALGRILAALIIPAVDAAKEAKRRTDCVWQMQKITVAMRLYACEHDGKLPPTFTVDSEGKPLHSWRVLLLPYLGYDEIYRRIRLDEPWDSPHNARLHAENISDYRCPSAEGKNGLLADGEASYSVVVGPDTLFSPDGGEGRHAGGDNPRPAEAANPDENAGGISLAAGRDPSELYQADKSRQTPKMFSVVERHGGVCWMKPDAEITQENALLGVNPPSEEGMSSRLQPEEIRPDLIGSLHPGGANLAFYGGNILFISDSGPQREEYAAKMRLYLTGHESDPAETAVEPEK